MRIELAKTYGFCTGVRRAIRLTEKIADSSKEKVQTFGPLIHNAEELDRLKSKGIIEINEISKIDERFSVVIRAHGVSPNIERELREKTSHTYDATCPLVKRIHGIVKMLSKKGYSIIIKGDINHPEVEGILGYAGKNALVISNFSDAKKLKIKNKKIALVSQSTEIPEEFEKISSFLKKNYPHIRIFDTICAPTKLAKLSAAELAKESDLMLVVGGKNSSNTKKLAKVCSKYCKTIQIESSKELNAKMVKNVDKIGITSGASTPDYIVKEVVKKLKQIENENFH